jgi:hypothetical protein
MASPATMDSTCRATVKTCARRAAGAWVAVGWGQGRGGATAAAVASGGRAARRLLLAPRPSWNRRTALGKGIPTSQQCTAAPQWPTSERMQVGRPAVPVGPGAPGC